MAGVTTRPFRAIALSMGCGLAWTEMVSAEGLIRGDRKTRDFLPARGEPGEVAVQLFGHRPETLRDAALIAETTPASIIDINMGCPVRKIVKGGSGAALLRDTAAIGRILEAICGAVKKPVTVKIRSGWDDRSINAVEVAKIAAGSGASAVTLHARTAKQGFAGRADWGVVADVARASSIPVVGNGDLGSAEEAARAVRESGCSAVMIGRAALRPWIFRGPAAAEGAAQPFSRADVGRLMLRHLELNIREFGERRGMIHMRRPLAWYSRGLAGAGLFRRRVNETADVPGLQAAIAAFAEVKEEISRESRDPYGTATGGISGGGTVPGSARAVSGS
jgi:nifR3 family TIM-barrel protein